MWDVVHVDGIRKEAKLQTGINISMLRGLQPVCMGHSFVLCRSTIQALQYCLSGKSVSNYSYWLSLALGDSASCFPFWYLYHIVEHTKKLSRKISVHTQKLLEHIHELWWDTYFEHTSISYNTICNLTKDNLLLYTDVLDPWTNHHHTLHVYQ